MTIFLPPASTRDSQITQVSFAELKHAHLGVSLWEYKFRRALQKIQTSCENGWGSRDRSNSLKHWPYHLAPIAAYSASDFLLAGPTKNWPTRNCRYVSNGFGPPTGWFSFRFLLHFDLTNGWCSHNGPCSSPKWAFHERGCGASN